MGNPTQNANIPYLWNDFVTQFINPVYGSFPSTYFMLINFVFKLSAGRAITAHAIPDIAEDPKRITALSSFVLYNFCKFYFVVL